jgi:hypothetical protein
MGLGERRRFDSVVPSGLLEETRTGTTVKGKYVTNGVVRMTEAASPQGGTTDPATDDRYQSRKECPICGAMVKGLPYHITQEHGE